MIKTKRKLQQTAHGLWRSAGFDGEEQIWGNVWKKLSVGNVRGIVRGQFPQERECPENVWGIVLKGELSGEERPGREMSGTHVG